MNTKVIKIKSTDDPNPVINLVTPDPDLVEHAMLPRGIVPDMVLVLHGAHYNLVVNKESRTLRINTNPNETKNNETTRDNSEQANMTNSNEESFHKYKRMYEFGHL